MSFLKRKKKRDLLAVDGKKKSDKMIRPRDLAYFLYLSFHLLLLSPSPFVMAPQESGMGEEGEAGKADGRD